MDKHAAELALSLAQPQDIEAITMGPESAKEALRDLLAMGVGGACHVQDNLLTGSDLLTTAMSLAAAIKKCGDFDLVICGAKSTDAELGVLPAMLAELLGISSVLGVEKLEALEGEVRASVPSDKGVEVWKVKTPCLVSVTKNINVPRLPSLRGMTKAMQVEIVEYNFSDLEIEMPANRPRFMEHVVAESKAEVEMIEGETSEEIAGKLFTALKLKGVIS